MGIIRLSVSLVVVGSAAFAGVARGADRPLFVDVAVGSGVDVAPTDVRRAVAAELGTPVVAADGTTADGAADLLFVALEPREVRMSLRAGTAPVVSRTIAVPPDRTGRLRSIGWLAGNLVRDQVGPIVATREVAAAPPVDTVGVTELPPLAATEAVSLAANEPPSPPVTVPPSPPVSAPPPVRPAPPAVVASRPTDTPAAIPHAVWSITAIGGPVVTVTHDATTSATRGSTFQLEVQRQPTPDSLLVGIALTAGPTSPRHYVGAAAFAGEAWRGQSWFAEATLGLGVEALDGYATIGSETGTAPTNGSPAIVTSQSQAKVPAGAAPGLFLRAAATGGLGVTRFFDLVAQLGAHLSSEGDVGSYLGATAGVRLRLP